MDRATKRREWTERLVRYRQAELTVAEFCSNEGVSVATFYLWKRKLGVVTRRRSRAVPKWPKSNRNRRRRKGCSFKPVNVRHGQTTAHAKIRLPDGIVIELGNDQSTIQDIVTLILDRQTGGSPC